MPLSLAAFVGQHAEDRHLPGDAAQDFHAGCHTIDAQPEHRVAVVDGRGLGPGHHRARLGGITHLRQVARAAPVVQRYGAETRVHLDQAALLRVGIELHHPLDRVLPDGIEIEGHWVDGVGCERLEAGVGDLLEHFENRHDPGRSGIQRRVRRSPAVGKPLCPEEFTVHDDRLEHLGHHRPLAAVQDVLLLLGQGHLVGVVGVVLLQDRHRSRCRSGGPLWACPHGRSRTGRNERGHTQPDLLTCQSLIILSFSDSRFKILVKKV